VAYVVITGLLRIKVLCQRTDTLTSTHYGATQLQRQSCKIIVIIINLTNSLTPWNSPSWKLNRTV